ncbi:MAG: cobalamin biosynthesis protein CobD [Planctomycetes bacterium]|nr:cobalamin biosynthesis protein CobD [Planctomycetota bacterium]
MQTELIIISAFCLDALVGDPRWLYHPVRSIGALAIRLEAPIRKLFRYEYLAGVVTVLLIVSLTGMATWLLLAVANQFHTFAYYAMSILLLYTTVATHDLAAHSNDVYKQLVKNDIAGGRKKVALIVGRDTNNLNEAEITRAAVESVAESTVDGITAPLFYALIAGPIGAMVYKAINTLDSTFGYKNDRYMKFGWASARLDDIANYLPARLTSPVMCLAAGILHLRPVNAFKVMLSDRQNHTSPNSGFTEATMAGALGVQLGGLNYYFGKASEKPLIGLSIEKLNIGHIKKANNLMCVTSILFLLLGLGLRFAVVSLWNMGGLGQ